MSSESCCQWCKTIGVTMQCSRCKAAFYCNEKCSTADWKTHFKVCVGKGVGLRFGDVDVGHTTPRELTQWEREYLLEGIPQAVEFSFDVNQMPKYHSKQKRFVMLSTTKPCGLCLGLMNPIASDNELNLDENQIAQLVLSKCRVDIMRTFLNHTVQDLKNQIKALRHEPILTIAEKAILELPSITLAQAHALAVIPIGSIIKLFHMYGKEKNRNGACHSYG